MSRSSSGRLLRRQVKKGVIAEIKRRTGRDASSSHEALAMVREKIAEKENAARVQVAAAPEQK